MFIARNSYEMAVLTCFDWDGLEKRRGAWPTSSIP